MKLLGQVAIVTGGGRNIGKEISRAFLQEGAIVVIADIDAAAAYEASKEMGQNNCRVIKMDVTKSADIKNTVHSVVEEFGKIDILINNAGIQLNKKNLDEVEESDWDLTMNVNLRGMCFMTQEVARIMKNQKHGKIVNLASIAGQTFSKENLVYTVSKGAVRAFTSQVAVELAEYNINVNAIAPGYINTELNKDTFSRPGAKEEICKKIPLGYIAEPEKLTGAVVFLVSDDASYITGQTIVIDGGFTLL